MIDLQVGTAVIGGGQAGLAVGYHLMQRGLPFVILDDNNRVGDAWRKRWDSLRLFTPGRCDGLPGLGRKVRDHFLDPPSWNSSSSALVGGVGRDAQYVVDHIVSARSSS